MVGLIKLIWGCRFHGEFFYNLVKVREVWLMTTLKHLTFWKGGNNWTEGKMSCQKQNLSHIEVNSIGLINENKDIL